MLALGAAVTTTGLLEGGLWLLHPLPAAPAARMHRFLPSWTYIGPAPRSVTIDPGPLVGVTPGVVENTWNTLGYLFLEEQQRRRTAGELRIAAVGGSTVECNMLAADKRWPAALARVLQNGRTEPVTVLNLGVSAQDTRTHLATTAHVVTDLDVDICVFLLGANDLGTITSTQHPMLHGDALAAEAKLPSLIRSALHWTQISRHLEWLRSTNSTRTTPYFANAAAAQASLPERPEPLLPTDAGLAHYARNIVSLAGLCKEHGVTPLFATQPCMFGDAPTDEELRAFWGCSTGTHRITAANFRALLASANARLLATCSEHGYPCLDLAREIPTGFASFYDQVHFHEAGAVRVAEAVAASVRNLPR